ncbi:MAG: GNAT family N-acetyltransferase [Chitinophagaceae bacterium]
MLPIIVNEHISLRELRLSDAQSISENANDKKIWDCVRDYFPHPYTIEHAKSFISLNNNTEFPDKLGVCFYNNVIGIIGINAQTDTARNSVELGYWLGVAHWGKGILSLSLPKAIAYFWATQPHINRIFASVQANNLASSKLLLKSGFVFEGCLKQAIYKNNVYVDELRYGLLRHL